MSATSFSAAEHLAAIGWAREDLYAFSRWMFYQRKGFRWQQAAHHSLICDALMRVYRGECKRLIINIPPRYSKTELAVVNFIAWCFGHVPDAEFIHASYSATLATNNSVSIRGVMLHEAYQEIFQTRLGSNAQSNWTTTEGGVMYAAGAGGTITGFGAGKHREGFGGCFPVGTRVWTEKGLMPINRIVRERMEVKVWSFDYTGRMVLRDVTEWHENPPNEIVRITFDDGATVECTSDHRFWTDNRGWVRADSLREDDLLPRVNCGVESFDHVSIDANRAGCGLDSFPVLPSCASGAIGEGESRLIGGELCAQVGADATFPGDVFAARNGLPGFSAPDLIYNGCADSVLRGNIGGRNADRVVDCQSLIVAENGDGVDFGLAERAVLLAVEDVCRSRVIAQIGEPVVGGIAVKMADVSAIRARADEGGQHNRVDGCVFDLGVSGQADAEVAAALHIRREQFAGLDVAASASGVGDFPVLTSDGSEVAYGVQPFIAGYRKPVFVESVRHDDVTFCLTVDEYHNFTVESGLVVKNCIIIDDPHKADEARSDVIRKGVIDWFQNTLESRKNSPETPIIVIMQRLHESDLAGWLLDGGNGEEWKSLILPVWQEDGTPLWPEKHDAEALHRMEKAAPYVFAGQYRQRPAPPDGGIFKPDQIQVVDALPAGQIEWVRGWDFGSTTDGDYTAGAKLGKLPDGRLIIGDMVHLQAGPDERDAALKNTSARDGLLVKISIPQDPGQAGKTQALYLTRMLAGFPVHSSPESGDKITRAEPFASQVNVGNVLMVRGSWNDSLINEMRMFPNGTYDDQIDGLSRAAEALMGSNTGMIDWMQQQTKESKGKRAFDTSSLR